jgi:hypothetical protein
MMRRCLGALAIVWLAGSALAQSFDNFDFEQSTLPPGPLPQGDLPGGQPPAEGFSDPLNPSWFNGEIISSDGLRQDRGGGPVDDGVSLRTNPDGQSGVELRTFPGTGPVTSISQPRSETGQRVTLRALDRMLGRPVDIELEVGQTVLFGRIAIHAAECRYPAETPASDAFAHLRVFDTGGNPLFDGWMVASSPALSALEHPRYDVWVLRCASTS